jgi:hypothetical protein
MQSFTSLTVTVFEARNLASLDSNGKSDPSCVVSIMGRENDTHKTKVIPKTLSPVWNETFSFSNVNEGEKIWIKIVDRDVSLFNKETFQPMGEVIVTVGIVINMIIEQANSRWFPVQGANAKGDIRLGFALSPPPTALANVSNVVQAAAVASDPNNPYMPLLSLSQNQFVTQPATYFVSLISYCINQSFVIVKLLISDIRNFLEDQWE